MNASRVCSVLSVGNSFDYAFFRIAIFYAEQGAPVWYISPQKFAKTPENLQTPENEVLKLITFIYLKDVKDLVTHLNGIHLWRKMPRVIILAGFEMYAKNDVNMASFVLSSLLASAEVCIKRNGVNSMVLVAFNNCGKDNEKLGEVELGTLEDLYFGYLRPKDDEEQFFKSIIKLFLV